MSNCTGILASDVNVGKQSTDDKKPAAKTDGTVCTALIKNGDNAGKQCTAFAREGTVLCGRHSPRVPAVKKDDAKKDDAKKDDKKPLCNIKEYLDDLHFEALQSLCDSGGMSDPYCAQLTKQYGIPPGKWWSCYYDGFFCQEMMSADILKMLSEQEKKEPLKFNANVEVAEDSFQKNLFWSQLRIKMNSLQFSHYKTLQAICNSGGEWDEELAKYGRVLGITASQWKACFSSGKGSRDSMANNITTMFNNAMLVVSTKVFNAPEKKTETSVASHDTMVHQDAASAQDTMVHQDAASAQDTMVHQDAASAQDTMVHRGTPSFDIATVRRLLCKLLYAESVRIDDPTIFQPGTDIEGLPCWVKDAVAVGSDTITRRPKFLSTAHGFEHADSNPIPGVVPCTWWKSDPTDNELKAVQSQCRGLKINVDTPAANNCIIAGNVPLFFPLRIKVRWHDNDARSDEYTIPLGACFATAGLKKHLDSEAFPSGTTILCSRWLHSGPSSNIATSASEGTPSKEEEPQRACKEGTSCPHIHADPRALRSYTCSICKKPLQKDKCACKDHNTVDAVDQRRLVRSLWTQLPPCDADIKSCEAEQVTSKVI